MRRTIIKIGLIILTIWVGGVIIGIMRISDFGNLPLYIIAIGMVASVKAIWSYNPISKEIDLKKDD